MKNFLFVIALLVCTAIQAQETHSIAKLQRKNNLKITLAKTSEGYFQSPFYLNNRRYFGLEYERLLKGRHSLTTGANFYTISQSYPDNYNSKWNVFGVELGYRYYLLQFKNKQPFNGLYTGIGLSSYYGYGKQTVGGIVKNNYQRFDGSANIKLGIQTTFLRRFTFDIENNYNFQKTSYTGNTKFSFSSSYFNTTLRIGYTF